MGKEMPATKFEHLDAEELIKTGEAFKLLIGNYRTAKDKLRRTTTRLLDTWQGDARSEFEQKYEFFMDKTGDLEDSLIEYYEGLLEAASAYCEVDEQIARSLEGEE